MLPVCGTGRPAASRPDQRSDVFRCGVQRKSGAPRTGSSSGSQLERHQFPDRRGRLAGDCGNGLCVRYGADFFPPAERRQTRGWYHMADFPDLRRDTLGRSLADPASSGIAATHSSNFGVYLVVDKMLWRRPDTATQGLAAFLRVGYAPPDRNLFSLEIDAGLTFKGLFP